MTVNCTVFPKEHLSYDLCLEAKREQIFTVLYDSFSLSTQMQAVITFACLCLLDLDFIFYSFETCKVI